MKRQLFLLFLLVSSIACFADEYKDPVSNVIYTYDPTGTTAEVKAGHRWDLTDNGAEIKLGDPGSPDANSDIIILDKLLIDGREYTVDKIGELAFVYMDNIVSINIPSSITVIDSEAFYGCQLLSNISLSKGLKTIGMRAFAGCHSLKALSIPEGLDSIGFEAFTCCSELKLITIPASVTHLDPLPFYYCAALSMIVSLIENPFEIEDVFDQSLLQHVTLYVPTGTKSKYEATSGWKDLTDIREFDSTGVKSSALHHPSSSHPYYDLSGRRLATPPTRRGVYVNGGRKVMIK